MSAAGCSVVVASRAVVVRSQSGRGVGFRPRLSVMQ